MPFKVHKINEKTYQLRAILNEGDRIIMDGDEMVGPGMMFWDIILEE